MARGRKPLPPHVKILKGTTKGRPMPPNAPSPQGSVERPKFLKNREAEIWDQYAPRLIERGLLTAIDAHLFGCWCRLAAASEEQMLPPGHLTQFRGIASVFGMEQSSRSRLPAIPDAAATDPSENYLTSADNASPLITEGSDIA